MKTLVILSLAVALLISTPFSHAQVPVPETAPAKAIEVVGTITEISPEAVVVRMPELNTPARYLLTKTTEYRDDVGSRLIQDNVKIGAEVTIQYVKQADRLVANRVIVRKHTTEKKPATPAQKQ